MDKGYFIASGGVSCESKSGSQKSDLSEGSACVCSAECVRNEVSVVYWMFSTLKERKSKEQEF